MQSQFDIFISHNTLDDAIAGRLQQCLARIRIGSRKARVFLDDTGIDFGENFVLKVEEALSKSKVFLVLVSANSVTAPWVRLEYSVMFNLDKAGSQGRIIPVLIGDCDPPPLLSVLKWCDLRGSGRRHERQLALLGARIQSLLGEGNGRATAQTPTKLLERVVAHSTPPFAGPDPRDEQLISNLVRLSSKPNRVWCASLLDEYSVFIKRLTRENRAPFIHRENRLWSFTDLSASGRFFKGLVDHGTAEPFTGEELENSPERAGYVIQLLNASVRSHCLQRALAYDQRSDRYYFRSEKDGSEKRRLWKVGRRTYSRKVAFPIRRPDGSIKNWIHLACGIRFLRSDTGYVLKLEPGYFFTWDGQRPVPSKIVGPWSTRLKSDEYNRQVFTHFRFWLSWMLTRTARKLFEFSLPPPDAGILLDKDFITSEVFGGIVGDYRNREELAVPVEDEELPQLEDVLVQEDGESLEEELEAAGEVPAEEAQEQDFGAAAQQDS